MITRQLLEPESIAIIGASNDTSKPGGKVLQNILAHGYRGKIFCVNPREKQVQGISCHAACDQLPGTDLAIIAISAENIEQAVFTLATEKNCRGFIIFSAGFSETGAEGRRREERIAEIVRGVNGTLIGPNCIGVITGSYKGVFAGPVPQYDPRGCDCVSASGATMVYLLEMAIPRGLKFRDIFSVGNSAQTGIEDVLQYWDESFNEHSSRIKLLYLEQIADPPRFLRHARSLVNKGCRIAAIKAGSTEAGSRAVASHTGALAGSNSAVNALFRKAGIIRCYSRVELVYMAAIFSTRPLQGDRLAVITHAGGPGVMLADILTKGGMKLPTLQGPAADALLSRLHPGSSVSNPIDFLATGNATQLGEILDAVENDFDEIDGSVVVFGTTGMWRVDDVYDMLHQKMNSCRKPVFPILPSAIQAAEEVSHFLSRGHVNFTDEVSFGYVLSRVNKMHPPYSDPELPPVDTMRIREIISNAGEGFLSPDAVSELLEASGIDTVKQSVAYSQSEALAIATETGFPLVMKVSGPVHKSDIGGVVLNINSTDEVLRVFESLSLLPGAAGVIIQQQISGLELYAGIKKEEGFGHLLLCGLGGIFVEVFRDVSAGLAPVGEKEALSMIRHLRSYPVIKGMRGKAGIREELFISVILKLGALVHAAPEIMEMDINPLIGNGEYLKAADARILVMKSEPVKEPVLQC